MDVADVVASFLTGTYVVTRRGASVIVNGRATPGPVTLFSIDGSVQPANGRDMLRLDEGRRTNVTRVIFTPTLLTVGSQGATNEADLVNVDGAMWEVQHVEDWAPYPGITTNFYRCIIQEPTAP